MKSLFIATVCTLLVACSGNALPSTSTSAMTPTTSNVNPIGFGHRHMKPKDVNPIGFKVHR